MRPTMICFSIRALETALRLTELSFQMKGTVAILISCDPMTILLYTSFASAMRAT